MFLTGQDSSRGFSWASGDQGRHALGRGEKLQEGLAMGQVVGVGGSEMRSSWQAELNFWPGSQRCRPGKECASGKMGYH